MNEFYFRRAQTEEITFKLREYAQHVRPMPGLAQERSFEALALQIVASIRRFDLTILVAGRPIDPRRLDPNDTMFDPDRCAAALAARGDVDEAIWVTFLATHFGKHRRHGWQMLKDVYSGLGVQTWTWERVRSNPGSFRIWLQENWQAVRGAFGNHRKYETLDPSSEASTANVIDSFTSWVGESGPSAKFRALVLNGGNDPRDIFDVFYRDMTVRRFARLGKFDFLALVGRLKLAPIEPGLPYLRGATGPLRGAKLLFGDADISTLEGYFLELEAALGVGQDVLEDAICNWQKSPHSFVRFLG